MNHNKSVAFACQEPSAPGLAPPLPGPALFREGESPSTFFSSQGPGASSDSPGPSSFSPPPIAEAEPWPFGLPPESPGPALLIPSRKAEKGGILRPPGGLPGGASFDPEASGSGSGVRGARTDSSGLLIHPALAPSPNVSYGPGPCPEAVSSRPPRGGFKGSARLESCIANVLKDTAKGSQKSIGLVEKWELLDRQREARELAKRKKAYLAADLDIEEAEERREAELLMKSQKEPRCGAWGVVGETEAGELFMRSTDCGREWCPKCRKSSHGRRVARWLPKALKINSMGYHVFTYPVRERPFTARDFSIFEWVTIEVLKRHGLDRGLGRFHWMGDKSVGVWNPHLNCLTESGHLSEKELASVKREICEELGLSRMVYYYHHSPDRAQKVFWLRYVTRPTFLEKEWAPAMALELYGFRNAVAWGRWEDPGPLKTKKAEDLRLAQVAAGYFEDKWALPRAEKALCECEQIKAGVSPDTGLEIHWRKRVKVEDKALEPGWDQIWPGLWQYKAPAKRVLEYRLWRYDYCPGQKGRGS